MTDKTTTNASGTDQKDTATINMKPAKTRATKTPRDFDSILKGVLSLSLKQRVDIINAASAQNAKDIEAMKSSAAEQSQRAAEAEKLVNGK